MLMGFGASLALFGIFYEYNKWTAPMHGPPETRRA